MFLVSDQEARDLEWLDIQARISRDGKALEDRVLAASELRGNEAREAAREIRAAWERSELDIWAPQYA